MTILHMETDTVRAVASQLVRTAELIHTELQSMVQSANSADWVSASRDQFTAEMAQLNNEINQQAEAAKVLAQRVESEVQEWEELSEASAVKTSSFIGGMAVIGKYILGVFTTGEGAANWKYGTSLKDQKREFGEYWDKLDEGQRRKYLEDQIKEFCKKYGLPENSLVIEDLLDDKGDARGLHNGNIIYLDSDNFKNDPPEEILRTIIHEARHEYQETIVNNYKQTGELPPGISKTQIETWRKNNTVENYIKPEDDPVGYLGQPIEQDARTKSTEFINDYLEKHGWK